MHIHSNNVLPGCVIYTLNQSINHLVHWIWDAVVLCHHGKEETFSDKSTKSTSRFPSEYLLSLLSLPFSPTASSQKNFHFKFRLIWNYYSVHFPKVKLRKYGSILDLQNHQVCILSKVEWIQYVATSPMSCATLKKILKLWTCFFFLNIQNF